MADSVEYGASGAGFSDTIARMQAQAANREELNRKEREGTAAQEKQTVAEKVGASARVDTTATVERLTAAINTNISALARETAGITANTAAWARNAAARAEAAIGGTRTPRGAAVAAEERVSPVASGVAPSIARPPEPRRTVVPPPPLYVAPSQSYISGAESAASRDLQAQIDAQLQSAGRVAGAQAQARSLFNPAAASVLASSAGSPLAADIERQRGYAATVARLDADRAAAAAVSTPPQQLRLNPGPAFGYTAASSLGAGVLGGGTTRGAGGFFGGAPQTNAPEAATRARVAEQEAGSIARLGAAQRETNQAYQASVASYANSSSALSRHGALTTEFIGALSRGQVTLREFQSQITATIGKFAGWAGAAALVYGAYEALKKFGQGAAQTQTGVTQLSRFIPGLGGPAGGGSADVPQAESTLRSISTQFNVPIKEVVDSMQIMARVFHNLSDAGNATRAVLAAVKLDQIPQEQATQYLTGISQSLNIQSGKGVEDVVSSLNALQNTLGARVSQTLPALARAAPAAQAGGLDTPTLEALVAVGVRAGITGPQVGTALLRSIGTFAFRPQSQGVYQQYGITAQQGDYGGLIRQVAKVIDTGTVSKVGIAQLAQALGGPLLGTRGILPILSAEATHPGTLQRATDTAARPPSYQADLNRVLDTVGERFKALGIALENFGSIAESAGALQPIIAALDVAGRVLHTLEAIISPITAVVGAFNQLPTVLRDVIGVLLLYKAAQKTYNSAFGATAQGFVGRLPGLDFVRSQPREAIGSARARLQTYEEPAQQREVEASATKLRSARQAADRAAAAVVQFEEQNPGHTDTKQYPRGPRDERGSLVGPELRGDTYDRQRAGLSVAAGRAVEKGNEAELKHTAAVEGLAQTTGDIAVLKSRSLSVAQKTLYLEERGLVAVTEYVNVVDAQVKSALAHAATLGRSGAVAATGTAASEAAAVESSVAASGGVAGSSRASGAAVAESAVAASGAVATGLRGFLTNERAAVTQARATAASGESPLLGNLISRTNALQTAITEKGGSLVNAAIRNTGPGAIREGFSSVANSQGGPLAGLIATQALGSAVGGGAGDTISGIGGSAATGAILAQLLGKGGVAGVAVGAGLGAIAGGIQHGGGSGIGSGIGGVAGAGIGALIGGGPVGAAVGFGIGSTIGGIAGGIISPPGKDDPTKAAREQEAKLAEERKLSGTDSAAGLSSFGDAFAEDLSAAFSGTGDAAVKAQGKVQQQITDLTAQLKAFGSGSARGQKAAHQLEQVAQAASEAQDLSPDKAGQIIDSARAALITAPTQQFHAELQLGGDPQAALVKAQAAYQDAQTNSFGEALINAQGLVANAQANLAKAVKTGAAKGIADAQKVLDTTRQGYTDLAASAAQGQQATDLAKQAAAQAAYQASAQTIQAQGALAIAQGSPSKSAQIRGQLAINAQQQQALAASPGADPKGNEAAGLQTKAIDLQHQLTQEGLNTIKSKQGLTAASIPSTDPVAGAQQQLNELTQEYNYIRSHPQVFSADDVRNSLAAVIKGRQAVADALQAAVQSHIKAQADYAASQTNDPLKKESIQIGAARQQLAAAVGPDNKLAAATNLNNLAEQHQATLISQRESTVQFQLSMNQITVEQAVKQLGDLRKIKNLSLQQRQSIESQIKQLQSGSNSGAYNLAPGTIKLPTVYDIHRAVQSARSGASVVAQGAVTADARTTINVTVNDAHQVHAVAAAIDRATGSRLHARLRSAGIRGS